MSTATGRTLRRFYDAMLQAYGPQGWWPGKTQTEIVVGAILTQNTNWSNVEKAIAQLRAADVLSWPALRDVDRDALAQLIRPAGHYNVKAKRLKNFITWLWEERDGDFDALATLGVAHARSTLLGINGIGPETADSILLYGLELPTFVVDAYTARIVCRHGLMEPGMEYDDLKALFEDPLPADVRMFNEYHALIVAVGKRHCKPQARCQGCPLEAFGHDAAVR